MLYETFGGSKLFVMEMEAIVSKKNGSWPSVVDQTCSSSHTFVHVMLFVSNVYQTSTLFEKCRHISV